jgi:hypothetical protein
MFNVNELVGRNCSHPGKKPWQPPQWCGDSPASWDTTSVRRLLEFVRDHQQGGRMEPPVAFELGNELFKPPHLSHAQAAAALEAFAELVTDVWKSAPSLAGGRRLLPPLVFGSGTNDCGSNRNDEGFTAVDGVVVKGFSFHNYPDGGVNMSNVLNASWLRHDALSGGKVCLAEWEAGCPASGFKKAGVQLAVTKSNAGHLSHEFMHGFFMMVVLGQLAKEGVALVARWSVTSLLKTVVVAATVMAAETVYYDAASDFWLYYFYNQTVGHAVLGVTGDDGSGVLVYARCAALTAHGPANQSTVPVGAVTLLVVNPSNRSVALSLGSGVASTLPRVEYLSSMY